MSSRHAKVLRLRLRSRSVTASGHAKAVRLAGPLEAGDQEHSSLSRHDHDLS